VQKKEENALALSQNLEIKINNGLQKEHRSKC
jgi:hypothetical protein